MSDDPYSILEVSRHASDAEIERAYDRLLKLFDPEHYPGSTEDARKRLEQLNAAYAEIRGGAKREATPDASEPDEVPDEEPDEEPDAGPDVGLGGESPYEPVDRPVGEPAEDGRRAAVADNLTQIGFISGGARLSNPAVDVLASLLPDGSRIDACLTCLGVKSNGQYRCRERSGNFRATAVTRLAGDFAVSDYVHPIPRTEIVLCTRDELAWTVSQYAGQRTDAVTLYSIPFDDILGASVRGHKHDVAEVWIADGPTVSVQTKPHEADTLCEYVERAATSE